jgi:type II secretory pathway predicted ATPase ExeA
MKKKPKKQERNRTDAEVAQIVDSEGLGYAITSYMGSEKFINRKLAKLWDEAKIILDEITAILDEAAATDGDEDDE